MSKTDGLLRFDLESRIIAEREDGVQAFPWGELRRIARLYDVSESSISQMRDRLLYPRSHAQSAERQQRIRIAVRALIRNGGINERGNQSRLAAYYGVTRQRVHQILRQETAA